MQLDKTYCVFTVSLLSNSDKQQHHCYIHGDHQYNPETSGSHYREYFVNQAGGNLPVFVGRSVMSGGGLGSLFSGALRAIVPVVKRVAPKLARRAFTVGKGVVGDVLGGKRVEASLKRRAKEAGVGLLFDMEDSVFRSNSSSRKRLKRIKKRKSSTRTRRSSLRSVL